MINPGCVKLSNMFFFFSLSLTHLSPFNPKQCLRGEKQQEGHLLILCC